MRPRTTEIVCATCRSVHSEHQWKHLPAVSEVAASELARLASRWSDDEVVHVRACHCGALLACPAPKRAPVAAPMPPVRSVSAPRGEAFVWM